jgi:hypothetical protein
MKLTKLAAVELAALTITVGVAVAAPGNAPEGTADEHADTKHTNDGNASAADDDRAASEAANAGPPTDVPEQVPDHVVAIHELIQQHIDGVLEGDLGAAVSNVASGGADGGDASENGTAPPTAEG